MLNPNNTVEYRKLFFEEAKKIIIALQEFLFVELTKNSTNLIFKNVHTLKAMSQVMGYDSLIKECHKYEDILKKRKHDEKELSSFIDKVTILLEREEDPYQFITGVKDLAIGNDDFETIIMQLGYIIDTIDEIDQNKKKLIFSYIKEIYSRLIPGKLSSAGVIKKYLLRVISTYQRASNKKIDFEFNGENIIIDSSIIGALTKILIQLVRNAISHGLKKESFPEEQFNKAIGKIIVSARLIGKEIVFSVSDDGSGVDYKKLRKILISKKIISDSESDKLKDNKNLNKYLFFPGVSTKDSADEFGGMGYGLSETKDLVAALSGIIVVSSVENKGATFSIRIPSNILFIKLKVFSVGNNLIGIDPEYICEIFRDLNENKKIKQEVFIDLIKFFKRPNDNDNGFAKIAFSGRNFLVSFCKELSNEEVIVLNRSKELFWKGFTKDSEMVLVLNLDYVYENY